jgi:hypothetical protein
VKLIPRVLILWGWALPAAFCVHIFSTSGEFIPGPVHPHLIPPITIAWLLLLVCVVWLPLAIGYGLNTRRRPVRGRLISVVSLMVSLGAAAAHVSAYTVSHGIPGWQGKLLGSVFTAVSCIWIPLTVLTSTYSFKYWNVTEHNESTASVWARVWNTFSMMLSILWLMFLGLVFGVAGLR